MELYKGNQNSKGVQFLKQVIACDVENCVLWPYAKDALGYGLCSGFGAGKSYSSHILIFKAIHGFQPEVVMHTCDNPSCVNPKHLQAGTKAANNKDRAAKGRSAKRVESRQRISYEQCQTILQRLKVRRKYDIQEIAEEYDVDRAVIYKILKGTYCGIVR